MTKSAQQDLSAKHTSMNEIHAEELEFLGQEIPFNTIARPAKRCIGWEGMQVELKYPSQRHLTPFSASEYQAWCRAALGTALRTWDASGVDGGVVERLTNSEDFTEVEERLIAILKKRHISAVFESATFIFSCSGITRSMTHQVVRHRSMAFGQQSLRVSSCYGDPVRWPQAVVNEVRHLRERIQSSELTADSPEFRRLSDLENYLRRWRFVANQCMDLYAEGVELGVPVEQARDITPNGTATKIDIVMRLREVLQYFKDRTQGITQGEHHYMVSLFARAMKAEAPEWWGLVLRLDPGAAVLVESPLVTEPDLNL